MNKLSTDKRVRVVGALVEGCSIRATVRMTGVAKNTVLKLLVDLGRACAAYQDDDLRNLPCTRVQCDEIWSFVGAKQKNVPEHKQGMFGCGDVWTWTAICADTKLVPSWLVGLRHSGYAKLFHKGCDPIDYFVEGSYDKARGEVVLQGQAPIYSGKGCKITGYTDSGSASKLRFARVGGEDDLVAAVPEKEERPGYLPPASATEEPVKKKRKQVAPTEEDDTSKREVRRQPRPQPRQRSASRLEEETYEDEVFEPEGYRDERDYNWRKRRAERDGRYDDEDADYYAELEEEEVDEDRPEFYEDYDEYDDEPAYYSRQRRWQRY